MAKFNSDNLNFNPEHNATTIGIQREFLKQEDLQLSNGYTADELPETSIIQYIRGYKWNVDFYNLNGGVNTKSEAFNPDLNTHTQNYTKIKDCIIYLTDPLEVTKVSDLSFTCVLNIGRVPFKYDVIVGTLLGGKKALFECTDCVQEHYQSHRVYKLTFKFRFFLENQEDSIYKNLESKVTKRYVYDNEYVLDNGSPILLEEDLKAKKNLKDIRNHMISFYFNKFIDVETNYLALNARKPNNMGMLRNIPLPKSPIIDEYLVKFLRSTIDINEDYNYSKMSSNHYVTNYEQTLFDAILTKDENILYDCVKEVEYFPPCFTGASPLTRNTYYLDIGLLTVPKGSMDGTFVSYNLPDDLLFTTEECPLHGKNLKGYYIFSQDFYLGQFVTMRPIERLIYKYIQGSVLNIVDIEPFLKNYRKWSTYEQYYILPLLIFIIKTMTHRSFSQR